MGAPILNMPMEVLLQIAEHTWYTGPWYLRPTEDHAALVRTCRGLYQTLNADLYKENIRWSSTATYLIVWAVCNNRLDTIKRAHVNGADLNMGLESYTETGPVSRLPSTLQSTRFHLAKYSPIHLAVLYGNSEIIAYLLDHGANVHAPSFGLCTCQKVSKDRTFEAQYPLHLLFCHGDHPKRLEILEKFISKGAYLVAENTSAIPQLAKITRGHLLGTLTKRKDKDSLAGILHLAIQMQDFSLVTQIFERALNKSITRARDWEGRTALHLAVNSFDWKDEIVRFLLKDNRASIFKKDHSGRTPLHYAAMTICSPKLVALLLQHRRSSVNTASAHFQQIFYEICGLRHQTRNRVDVAQQMINVWLKPLNDIRAYNHPLYFALQTTSWRMALRLIRDGIDLPSWASHLPKRGAGVIFPSLIACLSSFHPEQTEFVDAIVRTGCDLNPPEFPLRPELWPVFLVIVRSRNMDGLKALLDGGASVKIEFKAKADTSGPEYTGYTGILLAIFSEVFGCPLQDSPNLEKLGQFHDFIVLLLERGAPIGRNWQVGRFWYPITALDYAVTAARFGCFELLDLMSNHATETRIRSKEISASFAKQLNWMEKESNSYRLLKEYQGRLQARLGLN
ncbi:unnamed protein product [Clonostachys solani]|uniref:Uncharacterized protein n=1 Tax=Clonostachys solani TaxID=160281 RepID=A0A9N9ZG31_9HYPO|nr:unnamed protein product [Clonostachys solani]